MLRRIVDRDDDRIFFCDVLRHAALLPVYGIAGTEQEHAAPLEQFPQSTHICRIIAGDALIREVTLLNKLGVVHELLVLRECAEDLDNLFDREGLFIHEIRDIVRVTMRR